VIRRSSRVSRCDRAARANCLSVQLRPRWERGAGGWARCCHVVWDAARRYLVL